MQQDAFIQSETGDFPFEIRYEGRDANAHMIDMSSLAESLHGFSRVYAVIGHFATSGEYAKQMQALKTKPYALEPRAKCFSIAGLLNWGQNNGIFQGLGVAVFTLVISYVFSREKGGIEEMKHLRELFEKQLNFSHEVTEKMLQTIDRLATALEPSVKKSVAPIGESCDRIELYQNAQLSKSIDIVDKEAILAGKDIEIIPERSYAVVITEMDKLNRTCKVSFVGGDLDESLDEDGVARRIMCDITDPMATMDRNVYLDAFVGGKKIEVRAKACIKDGMITKLFISDAQLPT